MIQQLFYGELAPYFQDALAVRKTVFTDEQGYAEEVDYDDQDKAAFHVVIYDAGMPVATARLFEGSEADGYLIGRVAVLKSYRKNKLGKEVMEQLIEKAYALGAYNKITVHAQQPVQPFYEKLGFQAYGDVYLEEGQPHIFMAKELRTRGFEVAKGFEDAGVILPVRKTKASAGYDVATIKKVTMEPGEVVLVPTGLKAYMLLDEVLEFHIRSSVAIKNKVWCVNNVGIVDADYYNNPDNDGHLMVPLYNGGSERVTFEKGERVAQAIFKKYLTVDNENHLDLSERVGGFGSTGQK